MTTKDFEKHWKEKRKSKYFSKCVPNFNKKKTFEKALNELLKIEDFRKLSYDDRIAIMRKIFGDSRNQFDFETELKKAVKIGYDVKVIEKEIIQNKRS